ncbi:unnamed protein product [Camellia sinensis]
MHVQFSQSPSFQTKLHPPQNLLRSPFPPSYPFKQHKRLHSQKHTKETMAESAVFHLLANFSLFLQGKVNLLSGVWEEIEYVRDEFERMSAFLRVADSMEENDPELKVWVKQVRDAAYDTADVLDKFKLHLAHHHGDGFRGFICKISCSIKTLKARYQIAYEVQRIKKRVVNISVGHQRYHDRYGILEKGDPRLKVILVVGMGGLGKTTLVKKVYDDATTKKHFQIRAWINVSESFKTEELLKGMIRQLFKEVKQPVPQGVETMDWNSLKGIINAFLQQKRYVLVFDDLWDIQAWQAFRYAFPECNCGSRVMLTTRNADLASLSSKEYHGYVYDLQPLPPQESWVLFCRKTFQTNYCPLHLEEILRSILKRCEGLPLAIVAITGLLSVKDKSSIVEWEKIYCSLGAELEGNNKLSSMKKILSLSHIDLPYCLKLCFLYLSVFPKDHLIDHWRLIRLWIAEGFVEVQGVQAEEVAEGYLNELINGSLIQVAKIKGGRVKLYRIHDLWREIIVFKSREHNIVTIVNDQDTTWPERVRRLSIQNNLEHLQQSKRFARLRSLLLFSATYSPSKLSKLASLRALKLLNVLDLSEASLDIFPNEIVKLQHLKYLSLRGTKVKIIPTSIGKLKNLETLDLRHTYVTELPGEILNLQKLRHLLVYQYEEKLNYYSFDNECGFKSPIKIGRLSSLQKLSSIEANHGSGGIVSREIRKLTQLRTLGIVKLRGEDGRVLCSSLEKLNNLYALYVTAIDEDEIIDLESLSSPPPLLQTLFLKGRLEKLPHWTSSLHSLVTVCLWSSKLRDADPLQWEGLCFKAGGFQRLKILLLIRLKGLKQVIVEEDAMPHLEELYIRNCKLMEELPFGVEQLNNLTLLDLFDMSDVLVSKLNKDLQGGDYERIAHIPEVWIDDTKVMNKGTDTGYFPNRPTIARRKIPTEIAQVTEEIVNEGEKNQGAEKPQEDATDVNKENTANEAGEKEPEDKEMTLEEYEKVLEEKRKALLALKTEESEGWWTNQSKVSPRSNKLGACIIMRLGGVWIQQQEVQVDMVMNSENLGKIEEELETKCFPNMEIDTTKTLAQFAVRDHENGVRVSSEGLNGDDVCDVEVSNKTLIVEVEKDFGEHERQDDEKGLGDGDSSELIRDGSDKNEEFDQNGSLESANESGKDCGDEDDDKGGEGFKLIPNFSVMHWCEVEGL